MNVVGPSDVVDQVAAELGHTSAIDIASDRSRLDFRRIILSESKHAGRTIESLGLRARFGANIVRVRRGDVEFVGSPSFVLQLGDRLRVVGPTDTMPEVTTFLGDSERGLADLNPAAFGIGITIGLLLGSIQIPLPGGAHFSLGFAAGALIIGLVMGRVGRLGPFVLALPHTAATVLAELGLLIFLAYAGANAGSLIVPAFVSGEVFVLAGVGVVVTLIATFGTFLVVKYAFRTGRHPALGRRRRVADEPRDPRLRELPHAVRHPRRARLQPGVPRGDGREDPARTGHRRALTDALAHPPRTAALSALSGARRAAARHPSPAVRSRPLCADEPSARGCRAHPRPGSRPTRPPPSEPPARRRGCRRSRRLRPAR